MAAGSARSTLARRLDSISPSSTRRKRPPRMPRKKARQQAGTAKRIAEKPGLRSANPAEGRHRPWCQKLLGLVVGDECQSHRQVFGVACPTLDANDQEPDIDIPHLHGIDLNDPGRRRDRPIEEQPVAQQILRQQAFELIPIRETNLARLEAGFSRARADQLRSLLALHRSRARTPPCRSSRRSAARTR